MMAVNNLGFRWILLILFPMCFAILYLLYHQRDYLGPVYRNVTEIVRIDHVNGDRDLVFIGNSEVEVRSEMSASETDIAFFKFISKRHYACENSFRFGNALDGGWDMCLAASYRPKTPCLVYSFGISYDFTFDDAVSSNLHCTVRSFDPSMKDNDHRRGQDVWFYKLGIGGKNEINSKQWKLQTLPSILQSFNESDTIIDYLKMDVEGSEWPSLGPMLDGDTLTRVKQIGIEIHVENGSKEDLYNYYQLLKRLEDAGFRRWYFAQNYYHIRKEKNGFRSCCYEMVYINTKFL